jgi:hypothetical protein
MRRGGKDCTCVVRVFRLGRRMRKFASRMAARLSVFDRLGRLPPHHLGLAYTAAACVGSAFKLLGDATHSPGLVDLGFVFLSAAGLALYIVVTWYRQDDALAAGVLLALTLIIGSLASTVVVGIVINRSLTAGIALVTFGPLALLFQAIFLIPLSTAIVWIARRVSVALDRATGASRER